MNKLVLDVLEFIDNNLYEEINIDLLAKHFCYDKFYIMKSFKKELGISIITYINYLKVLRSLSYYNNDDSILKIALCNGYNSLEYYSEIFKTFLGVSPIAYKKYVSGEALSLTEMELLKNSIGNITAYSRFISNYRKGIILEEEKGISLVLYKDNKENKKVAA
jgi:AraC-like DNA-binding protein